MQVFKVRTLNGLTVYIEANTQSQAIQRAQSPRIVQAFVRIVQDSMSRITSVEPLRRHSHSVQSIVFEDEFFNS